LKFSLLRSSTRIGSDFPHSFKKKEKDKALINLIQDLVGKVFGKGRLLVFGHDNELHSYLN
jgi:hypothetical protein